MNVYKTGFPDLIIFEPSVYEDDRGCFYEAFREKSYLEQIGQVRFVQDNISRSIKNTLRGLNFQNVECAQGKLCQVLDGAVLDVAVDIRKESPSYGKYFSIELSEKNKKQIWIPPGFAHGFSVLSDSALFHYKCTNYYNKASERCIIYSDPDLNIDWKVLSPIVSPKDKQGLLLCDLQHDYIFS